MLAPSPLEDSRTSPSHARMPRLLRLPMSKILCDKIIQMNLFPWMSNEKIAKNSLDFLQKKIKDGDFVSPISSLPYSKSKMRKAILKFAPKFIKSSNNPKKEQGLVESCYMSLSNFMNDDDANMILITRINNSFEKT